MQDTLTATLPGELPSEAVQRLMEKLQRQPDFPALQSAVTKVQRIARNDLARVQTLADAVLGDPGFSHRLLRLINAAYYRSAGAGTIGSVQRAIAVMGFRAVQELGIGVRLLDKLPHDRQGRALREDFLRALLAARLASEMCRERRWVEDAYVTALFQNLGRMLTSAHLPDDALAVRDAVPRTEWPMADREQEASRARLGLSYGELGAQVGWMWGLPRSLRGAMHRTAWPQHPAADRAGALRWLGLLANDLGDLMLYVEPALWPMHCVQLAERAGAATGQGVEDMRGALARTREQIEELAGTVGLPLSQLADWHRADVVDGQGDGRRSAAGGGPGKAGGGKGRRAGAPADSLPIPLSQEPAPANLAGSDLLARESLALSNALLDEHSRAEVPGRALTALWLGLGARRAVLFLRRPGRTTFVPAQLLGAPLPIAPGHSWSVDPAGGKDLFSRLCARGADTLIDDADQPEIARHLPRGFQRGVRARHFLVLPMTARGRSVGMIYVDREDENPFVIDDREMRFVRTLRNQAAIALA